ncbi:hypothetical protein COCNU_16G000380 [Cocos nucifera]|uniref:Uncharacterized protein n=1 Tax=Cocos nucifera TaxID=13894 RepID=A0A8K0IXS4_COCNU|nr:hypothetical protein COCNU_16G000380 [Cocos nucifera]
MNPSDLKTLRRMAKKRKTSMAVAPKRARMEAILAQPTVGGSSVVINSLRKEKALVKDVMLLQSAAPGETVHRPSASSSKRSSGGPKISIRMSNRGPNIPRSVSPIEVPLDTEDKRKGIDDYRVAHSLLKSVLLPANIQAFEEAGGAFRIQDFYDSLLWLVHHVDHFAKVIREVQCLSKEAEEKAAHANRRADDAQLSRLKVEDETRSLREMVKLLEFELTKAEAWVLGEREARKVRAEAIRVEAVQAFHASEEFRNIKEDFASLSYLQGGIDLKEKIQRIFSDLNMDLLESDDKEAEGAEGRVIQMEDIFSPMRDDLAIEDGALVPPPAVIDLSDQAMVGESGAPDEA